MSKQLIDRQEQGRIIAKMDNSVKRINDISYTITSQSGNGSYDVHSTEIGWVCSCPDHICRGVKCKHIFAVEISFALREQVKKEIVIAPIDSIACIFCNSDNVVKSYKTKQTKQYTEIFV